MTDTMLAARAHDTETRFRLEEIPVPEIGDEDVLVAVAAAGITRGLLSLWQRTDRIKLLPAVLGHEIAGTVTKVGRDVRTVSEGDRVRVHSPLTRRDDLYALTDNEAASPDVCVIGHAIFGDSAMPLYERYHNGGLAEYVRVPHWSLDLLPSSIGPDIASRVHSLGIAWRALRKADPASGYHGATLVVAGATGAAGGAVVRCAPLWGVARIIAVARTRAALERTASLAPGLVEILPIEELEAGWEQTDGLSARIRELTGGRGADCVIDYLPASPAITLQAIFAMANGGTAVLGGGNWSPLTIPYGRLVHTNYQIKGSNGLTRRDAAQILSLIEAGRLDPAPLFTHRMPLERVNDAVELIETRAGTPLFITIDPPSSTAPDFRAKVVAADAERREAAAAAAPAGPTVGGRYDLVIDEEFENQWTGPLGIGYIEGHHVQIPHAKVGDRFRVRVVSVGVHRWTGKPDAQVEIESSSHEEK